MSMTTSTLNGMTNWTGPGNSTYDAAAAILGEEVNTPRRFPNPDLDTQTPTVTPMRARDVHTEFAI